MGIDIYPSPVQKDLRKIINPSEVEPYILILTDSRKVKFIVEPVSVIIPAGIIDVGNKIIIHSEEWIGYLPVVKKGCQNSTRDYGICPSFRFESGRGDFGSVGQNIFCPPGFPVIFKEKG